MKFGGRGGRVKNLIQRIFETDRKTTTDGTYRQTDCLMPQSVLPFTHMLTEILNSTMTRAGDPLVLVTRKEPVFAFCPLK